MSTSSEPAHHDMCQRKIEYLSWDVTSVCIYASKTLDAMNCSNGEGFLNIPTALKMWANSASYYDIQSYSLPSNIGRFIDTNPYEGSFVNLYRTLPVSITSEISSECFNTPEDSCSPLLFKEGFLRAPIPVIPYVVDTYIDTDKILDINLEMPTIVLPNMAIPNISTPDIVVPSITIPDIITPDIITPDIVTPDIITPDIETPDVIVPDIITPDIITPDIITPDIITPDVIVPDVITPDVIVPDIITPDVIVPDIITPDIVTPDIETPDVIVPDIIIPDQTLDIKVPDIPLDSITIDLGAIDIGTITIPDIEVKMVEEVKVNISKQGIDLAKLVKNGYERQDECIKQKITFSTEGDDALYLSGRDTDSLSGDNAAISKIFTTTSATCGGLYITDVNGKVPLEVTYDFVDAPYIEANILVLPSHQYIPPLPQDGKIYVLSGKYTGPRVQNLSWIPVGSCD